MTSYLLIDYICTSAPVSMHRCVCSSVVSKLTNQPAISNLAPLPKKKKNQKTNNKNNYGYYSKVGVDININGERMNEIQFDIFDRSLSLGKCRIFSHVLTLHAPKRMSNICVRACAFIPYKWANSHAKSQINSF